MPSRPWLPPLRHLLGEIPDREVARRAGTVQSAVTKVRTRLGIPVHRNRTLESYSAEDVLRFIRARSKRGENMRGAPVDDFRLANLCRYHLNGWYQAVETAGLKPQGKPLHSANAGPTPRRRALTPALLRGTKSAAELERLTGVTKSTNRYKRELLGIVRDERQRPDLSWLPAARRRLGKVSDKEIAQGAGVAARIVTDARKKLGIAQMPKKSMATSGFKDRLRMVSKRELGRMLAALNPIDAKIVEARYLQPRPVPLAQLGASLGTSRQRVAQRERRATETLKNWI